MNRNKSKAAVILDTWKCRAIYEQNFKLIISTREKNFKISRALRKFAKNKDFKL